MGDVLTLPTASGADQKRLDFLRDQIRAVEEDIEMAREARSMTALANLRRVLMSARAELDKALDEAKESNPLDGATDEELELIVAGALDELSPNRRAELGLE
jgi:hypothetical protein